jgi:hypothetical protein
MPDVDTKLTAKDVHRALYRHFEGRWAQLTEVTARPKLVTGREQPDAKSRRIDVLLIKRCPPDRFGGDPYERLAIEIKVTRADFLSDVRAPEKQGPWREIAHRHAYACPAGMVATAELPPGSGLITVSRQKYDPRRFAVEWAVRAKQPTGHVPEPLPLANIMDAFWRAGRAEAQLKGYASLEDHPPVEALVAEVTRLRHELELAENRTGRAVEARQHWQRAYGAVGAPACSTCGHPLRPKMKARYGSTWAHPDPQDAGVCELLRTAAAEVAYAELPEGQRWARMQVPDPEPVDMPGELLAVAGRDEESRVLEGRTGAAAGRPGSRAALRSRLSGTNL